ncbi:MAG: phenylalanine--tRNA ligase subunit beta, partial [Gammaproteobacteria bacterium]|nr:phenylalanine--tRNA ligase subunit beta [Gammaproteobacteria bacterium]
MKFSEAWLREWVDPDIDQQTLLDQLTMAGLEVEVVEAVAPPLPDVVVARIEACDPHSDGGHLSICQVADGNGHRQVVCGAPNARAGVLTALALPGSELPGGIAVEAAQIRGTASAGMLCSAAELGLGDDAAGILELDDGACGMALAEALALDDVSIEIKLTPNRGDCLSLRGLAREVGVLNGLPVRHQDTPPTAAQSEAAFPVTLADPAGCPRYLGRVIEGIDLSAQAPLWMRERLRRCGLRSINAVVDVTNYVMLELGQPMHAFDLSALSKRIIVRRADPGEPLKMLDGRPISLSSQDLVIADETGPVAIAGVMGGERSGVQATTEDVFLECAWFDPRTVAETARRFGLHTDASHRYERGVDHQLQHQAMERATALLLAIVGGRAGPTEEALATEGLPDTAVVSLRQRRLHQLAGAAMDADQVDAALARLDFQLRDRHETDDDGVVWTIAAPSHRFDIGIEADLVEEVCRIHGYDNIPSQTPNAALRPRPKPLQQSGERQLKAELAALGFQEVITYSFVDPDSQTLLDPGTQA